MGILNDVQEKVYDQLVKLSAEEVARCFLNYHGFQLIDDGFAKHLVDEGFCSPEDVGLDDDDEEEEDDE